jgi:hypothetical protein
MLEFAEDSEGLIFCSGRESRQSKNIDQRKIRQMVFDGREVSQPAKKLLLLSGLCGLCERQSLCFGYAAL